MTCTVGGVTGGYWANGRRLNRDPASVITIDSTAAKIGRSMKKRENTIGTPARVFGGTGCSASTRARSFGRTLTPGLTRCKPLTMNRSPGASPLSIAQGNHFVKFGGRLRAVHEVNTSSAGFNGVFSFPSLTAYQDAYNALAAGDSQTAGPSQFTLDATESGVVPTVPVTVVDAGLYVQDDWKVRPNITRSGGLRFETQNAIHDHGDWAPRLSFAWGLGGGGKNAPKTVLRGGFGLFYDRFTQNLVLNADRLNGITQQQYAVSCPPTQPAPCPQQIGFFPNVPPPADLTSTSLIYSIDAHLHST